VITGAGRGWGKVLIGVLLVAGAMYFGVAGGKLGLEIGAGAAKVMTQVGISMTLYGVAEMLSPVPKMPDDPEQLQSFSFSGVVNTSKIGTPVPIAYGRLFVGSSVISSGLDVDQLV
jgi:predicted phage tail protein